MHVEVHMAVDFVEHIGYGGGLADGKQSRCKSTPLEWIAESMEEPACMSGKTERIRPILTREIAWIGIHDYSVY